MRRRFFQQNIRAILLPVIIPSLILGSMAIWLIHFYLRSDINKHNVDKIQNIVYSIDSLVNELDRINISLGNSPAIIMRLKRILSQSGRGISAEDHTTINTITDLLYSSSSINEYINSLYIYLNNPNDYLITNTNRLIRLSYFNDKLWYDSYLDHLDSQEDVWSELREIPSPIYTSTRINVLTIYRKIYASAKTKPDGVLVLNVKLDDINKALNASDISNSQIILVVNKHGGDILFNNRVWSSSTLSSDDLAKILDTKKTSFSMKIGGVSYAVNLVDSLLYDWKYISLISSNTLYRLPNLITQIILILILITSLIGLCISYFFACKNYKDIKNIIHMIDCAVSGKVLPDAPSMKYDIYQYIVHNILKTFLENSYLQTQLSEKHYHMKMLELLAMQSQLNPHFLFNTMDTLYWKSIAFTGTPNEATMIIENLSDILRYVLTSDNEKVLLSTEIQITQSYLDIQSIRYQDKFDVIWDYPLACQNIKIIKLILQPLVENSIYHGIRRKKGKSKIKIRIRQLKDTLRISVIDSGAGMNQKTLTSVRQHLLSPISDSSEHIGLYNTNKRIQLVYGEEHGLQILSRQNLGTVVRIVLPLSV